MGFEQEVAVELGGSSLGEVVHTVLADPLELDWTAYGGDHRDPELLRLIVTEDINVHIWGGPDSCDGVVHSHVRGFRSAVVCGELREWVYEDDPGGDPCEVRFTGRNGGGKVRTKTLPMRVTEALHPAGTTYERGTSEMHLTEALQGTVTVQRWEGPLCFKNRRTIATRKPGFGSPVQDVSPEIVAARARAALALLTR